MDWIPGERREQLSRHRATTARIIRSPVAAADGHIFKSDSGTRKKGVKKQSRRMKDLVIFLFVAGFCCVAQVTAQSNCHLRELDLCAASLLVFTQGPSGVADSDAELDKQCTFIKEADECIRNYTSVCATDVQQQLANMVFDGTAKLQKDYCTKGSKLRELYMKHSPCLRNAMRDAQKPCMKDLQTAFEAMTSAKWDKRIGLGCCSVNRVGSCLARAINATCGAETRQFIGNMTSVALSRLPDLICGEFTDGSPACSELPPPGTPPKGGKSTSILNRLLSAYTNF